jgi:hypothetical protein
MGLGDDADQLAAALSDTTFDAVERDGLRAEWVGEGHQILVRSLDGEEEIHYDAEDLVRAASDTEMRNARVPGASDEPE